MKKVIVALIILLIFLAGLLLINKMYTDKTDKEESNNNNEINYTITSETLFDGNIDKIKYRSIYPKITHSKNSEIDKFFDDRMEAEKISIQNGMLIRESNPELYEDEQDSECYQNYTVTKYKDLVSVNLISYYNGGDNTNNVLTSIIFDNEGRVYKLEDLAKVYGTTSNKIISELVKFARNDGIEVLKEGVINFTQNRFMILNDKEIITILDWHRRFEFVKLRIDNGNIEVSLFLEPLIEI